MKASDISNEAIFAAMRKAKYANVGASRWEIYKEFPDIPEKIVQAKLSKMIRRGKIDGCACGCRGDFTFPKART